MYRIGNIGLRPENKHGFIYGSIVQERGTSHKSETFKVVSTSGFLKTDLLQLNSKRSAWVRAKDYRLYSL